MTSNTHPEGYAGAERAALAETPCRGCDGSVERELAAVYPSSDLCLECMPSAELLRLEKDLNEVQQLDRSLLPSLGTVRGWDVGLHYRPSRILSGDFYEARGRDDGARLSLLVGDVMGKGIPAALLRSGLQSALTALAPEVASPGGLLERANRHFLGSASPGRLASVFYGAVDTASGTMRYASAGHPPPLLRRASGRWESLDPTGMVLGAVASADYEDGSVSLARGDVLVLFSDGFTEAENARGELFDQKDIVRRVDRDAELPAQVLASTLADDLSRFAPGEPSDDRTLLVVRRQ